MKLKILVLLSFSIAHVYTIIVPEVQVTQGTIIGSTYKTSKNRTYFGFTGIPFAKPPVGPLRFKPPVPSESWEGVLFAKSGHAVCPQANRSSKQFTGDEDCLYLNIYVPDSARDGKVQLLPVILYIHGGSFSKGSGNESFYGPDILLNRNIVLVTINHRLGALGFISTADEVVPGNNGLKDQSLALKWVKKNINAFRGDPDNISLFGHSSGAASAHFHYFSPLSKNLFKRIIAQSGTAFSGWTLSPATLVKKHTQSLARLLNCSRDINSEMIECMRGVKVDEIVKHQTDIGVIWAVDPVFPFRPVVEPVLDGAFLANNPEDILKAGNASNVPFMTGITTEDGGFTSSIYLNKEEWANDLNTKFNQVMPLILGYYNNDNKDNISLQLRQHYFGNQMISEETRSNLTALFTDAMFGCGALKSIKMHLTYSNQPVYYYVFGYRGAKSYSKFYNPDDDNGVHHADELVYLFPLNDLFPNYTRSNNGEKMSELLTLLWTNFIYFNNPTPENDGLIDTEWKPVTTNIEEHYFIKSPLYQEMRNGFHSTGIRLFENLNVFPKVN